jgi:perosamine synthetase
MGMPPARVVFPAADRAEIAAAIADILASGTLTLGPYTARFEEAFGAAHGGAHAVATASGTSALEIALRVVGVSGRSVVLPANTFYATAAAVVRAGARPVFADIDPATFALSPQALEKSLEPDTAAAVLVHIGGLISPHAIQIAALCRQRGIVLVEDAAHAHGSTCAGRHAGGFGVAAAFSFYPTKLVTCGEGGMLVTSSAELAAEARIYRDQGKGSFGANHHVREGYAWRMSEQNAVTGLVHLRRLPESVERRRAVAARYDKALKGIDGIEPLAEPAGCRSNVYKYIAVLPPGTGRAGREALKRELAERHRVRLAGEVYDLPLHLQPVLRRFAGGPLPVAEDLCARHICLPVHSDMTDDEADEVIGALAEAWSAGGARAVRRAAR